MDLVILSSKNQEELIKRLSDAETMNMKHDKMSIVIDGSTLTMVLDSEIISQRFFFFGCKANSVICCRVSPK
jgi:magnesium-transporting ATPase (P-type)